MSSVTFLDLQFALRIGLAVMFVTAGILHFLPKVQRGMAAMIPPRLRFCGIINPRNLVIFTGICEIAGGVGLLITPVQVAAGVALILFLAAVFPANAFIAGNRKRFGRAAIAFAPRLVAQFVLMALLALAVL